MKNDSFEWPTGHEFRDYHWASDRGGALLVRKEPIGERRFPIGSTIRVMHPDKSVSNFRNDTEQLPLSVSTLQGRTVLGSIIKGRKLIVEEIDLPSPK